MHLPHTYPSLKTKKTEMSPGRTSILVVTQNVLTPPSTFSSLTSVTFSVLDLIFNL
ncbi:hypothetical protein E2C01_058898 [Portunus trituberculatus]|uniref:Uncharacterized protein n=1 Tax=Portunus trituberculatus TaxID=210409 RepID=A0A5B7H5Y6_PORTR|nr:hypothetical protein [Portunus trituberculatus]